eukprot:scaffold1328_cov375-Pavlova_lutheri.AAC.25
MQFGWMVAEEPFKRGIPCDTTRGKGYDLLNDPLDLIQSIGRGPSPHLGHPPSQNSRAGSSPKETSGSEQLVRNTHCRRFRPIEKRKWTKILSTRRNT